MTTVVIGGAGFLGSHLVERLLAEGVATDVVDDLSTGALGNLAEARASGGAMKIHTLDVRAGDFGSLVGMRRPELIYHLGLLAPGQIELVDGTAVTSVLAVLEAARAHGVAKVVVALPAADLYGDVPSRDLPVKEGQGFQPHGLRGVLARTVADILDIYRNEHSVEHTVLAMTSVYGPRQRPGDGVVASFTAAAAAGRPLIVDGDGRQTRDFLYADDAVDALYRAGQRGGGLLVNIGTGIQTSVRDLAAMIAPAATVITGPRRHGDIARVAVSATRARIHLQWSPWTDLAAGLRSTLASFGRPPLEP